MNTYILVLHVLLGSLTIVVTILPLFGVQKLQNLFLPGYFGVAVSGIGLAGLTQQSIAASCVRFLVVMGAILVIRILVSLKTAKARL